MTWTPPFPWVISVAGIPKTGLHQARELSAEEREALAAHAGIQAVNALSAHAELTPIGEGVEVEVSFAANVVQTCVLTLEPVEDQLDEAFKCRFLSPEVMGEDSSGEVEFALDDEDPPEPLTGDALDLAPILIEHFILALDPYPTAPGASLPSQEDASKTADSPFAILQRLKPKT